MNRERIIGLFFAGLLLLAVFEVSLAGALSRLTGLPILDFGWLNPLVGLLAGIVGGSLVVWSVWIQYTEGEGTPAPAAATKKLIVSGPYAFTRNPMTLGAALFYLGIAFGLGSGVLLSLVLLIFTSLITYIYFHETRELSERFGPAYLAYRQQTPFLIPKFRKKGGNAILYQTDQNRRKKMSTKLTKAAALLAFAIGAMAIFAGGKVLLGQDPGYYVIDWLPVYNFSAGLITFAFTAIVIWKNSPAALPAAVATLGGHSIVMAILQTSYIDVVAPDSIRAMTVRILVWTLILTLLLVQAWKDRRTQAKNLPMQSVN